MEAEKELEGLKREMEAVAECLDELGDELDTDAIAAILRALVSGQTAERLIFDYALTEAGV